MASSREQQSLHSCWVDHYQKVEELERIREIDKGHMSQILEYNQKHIRRIRRIDDPLVKAWVASQGSDKLQTSDASHGTVETHELTGSVVQAAATEPPEPLMCLGSNCTMALVPSSARPGDIIVRFWNCDVAIVMRPIVTVVPVSASFFKLVGRADVASMQGLDLHAHQCPLDTSFSTDGKSRLPRAVYVDLNMRTMQSITAGISIY